MLDIIKRIDGDTVERLFSLYSESMSALEKQYDSLDQMKAAYTAFLTEFTAAPGHLVLVEKADGIWVSGLRAVETADGRWFLEAVETMPEERKKGYGEKLLLHTIGYLQSLGMTALSCTIGKNNVASMALHQKCGFIPTDEPPVNPWGELEEGTVLFRFGG